MQVYHNSGRMRDFGHMPDFGRKTWLRSYAWLRSEDMTPIVYLDSGDTSRLWLTSRLRSYLMNSVAHHGSNGWAGRMPYHLSCERLCMTGLDDCDILQPGHLVESKLGGMHDSFSIQNLSISRLRMFKCQVMCRATDGHLAWLDLRETWVSRRTRYPCNSSGSRYSNVWSGKLRLYAMWPWH
jgi:hypothetical protein